MRKIIWSICGALVVLSVSLYALNSYRHDTTRTFWGMLSNNLSTSGVTREVGQSSGGVTVEQYTQLSLGASNTAHSITTFGGNGGAVATEEISTPSQDLVRYRSITATKTADAKPIDPLSVIGKWAKLGSNDSLSSGLSAQLFQQSLQGVLPIANLSSDQRAELLQYARSNDVFKIAGKVTTVSVSGRKAYKYSVSIKPAPYIAMMQRFGKLVGATGYDGVDPNDYSGAANIAATVTVDIASRQLVELDESSSSHVEHYSGYGIVSQVAIPKATLTTDELQKRVAAL